MTAAQRTFDPSAVLARSLLTILRMRLVAFCVPLLLFFSCIQAQQYSMPVQPSFAPLPTHAPSTLPYQNFQPWPSQQHTQAPSWPVNVGAAQQFPAPIQGSGYPQASYQQSMPIYGAQQPISSMPINAAGGGAVSAGGLGDLSMEQLQQLALQAAQPTLSQWAADTAQAIFARSRGRLNNDAAMPAANILPQQAMPSNGLGSSFTFASPAVPAQPNIGATSPAAARAAYAVLPSNGQFIPNSAPAPPAAVNAPVPIAAIPPSSGN